MNTKSDTFRGMIYGVIGDATHPTHAPRCLGDHAKLDPNPHDPEAGGWWLWEGFREVEHGAQSYDDDGPRVCWIGVPVPVTTAPLSHYAQELDDMGAGPCVREARVVWQHFREHCLREANYDPGEGSLLMVCDRWSVR